MEPQARPYRRQFAVLPLSWQLLGQMKRPLPTCRPSDGPCFSFKTADLTSRTPGVLSGEKQDYTISHAAVSLDCTICGN